MNVNISFNQFEQLYKQGITLDMLFLLYELHNNEDDVWYTENPKIENVFQTISRKGLCTEDGHITISGKELLNSLKEEKEIPIRKKRNVEKNNDEFEKFWTTFPSTDTFSYKGKTFQGTRSLKAKKEECKIKLKAILNEGEYTIDEICKAIELEILQKKENSIKTGTNKLSFMQNSCTFLLQRSYESFIELIKEGIEIKETNLITSNGTDI